MVPNYPVKMDKHNTMGQGSSRVMRPNTTRIWREDAKYKGMKAFAETQPRSGTTLTQKSKMLKLYQWPKELSSNYAKNYHLK